MHPAFKRLVFLGLWREDGNITVHACKHTPPPTTLRLIDIVQKTPKMAKVRAHRTELERVYSYG